MEDHSQSPLYSQAKEHWKEYRPKMYKALEERGTLKKHLNSAVERTGNEYCQAIEDGLEPQEAWEIVRENYLFLPSEEDMPSLGEDPNPEPDQSALASTTRSRLRMRSGPVRKEQSMLQTLKQSKSSNQCN